MSDTHPVAAAPLPHDFCYRTFQPHVYSTTFRMFRIFRFGVSRGRSKEHVMTRARASGNSPVWPRSLVRKMGGMGSLSGVRISWFAYSHISLELSPSARAGRWDRGERKNESV